MKVSIIGATGYGGLELIRLLHQHPLIDIASLHSFSTQTETLADFYPHLKNLESSPLNQINPAEIIDKSETVFLATPSGISKDIAVPYVDAGLNVIDLSGDFRLKNGQVYEKWYGKSAAPESYLTKAVYGLAEFQTNTSATFIANPGCYATATLLGLAPLVRNQLIEPTSIIVDGKSGISGAGKAPSANTHFTEINENMTLYKMNAHQHIPEIMQQLNSWDESIPAIQFSTSLIPITRGIFITIYVKPKMPMTKKQLHTLYTTTYENSPFVRIQPEDCYPTIKQVTASNYCDIGLAYNEKTNTITIVSVIDNLVKGAAGQAIQNLNIIANFAENDGLNFIPVYP
ncbi:N-acetyl-gamma-glutamyl-phosphate reductase [Listeria ivanovii]|uniref:N-acetyl-gamma-glutamyl-phosphate reductase n=1 Tax=Listeria ivanovii (strain ATCC BAA-678 / PAM 55) TaxID=881621 RepID=G2Z9T2_LISIP|nr:N-acetyl-gamma-glutamyl-phosphate reductase [Listeria ivanovii]AHI56088.1 N-acetyl-gamma-glutamyl-phosphate reductase [Listeria ivanovii WSLC3009]AIS65524.1 N-acetyl-gamma-glutamyl-phosphate reductase [Listeria ivanovii subsp. ivanovii]MBC1759440.1 N-acetyl-gamma-glutamyl-phosphate reductase [Listeria ivanovii]MBK3914310.1 N-acetyl-gamma-glutamyl-phosphate reductase [Listeria ivanovii subsp. ivanovii]MBK3921791.1 N-acetyl-gamma-glutamyl-phosphate reductase [Listeria ivanovii subsp. ivanovii